MPQQAGAVAGVGVSHGMAVARGILTDITIAAGFTLLQAALLLLGSAARGANRHSVMDPFAT